MVHKKYLSTTEYAKMHKISRMQTLRLIKSGKVYAERIGRNWLIPLLNQPQQFGLEKTTSLQLWNKIIKNLFNTSLNIEETKDRELIYAKLNGLGLPHERCLAFPVGEFPSREKFISAVNRIGKPYWISAVPNPTSPDLDRLSKLGIYTISSGWNFVTSLPNKKNYKVIISQYPDGAAYKGSLLISPGGYGIAEFVTGDRHYIMTRGFTLTNPMLFDSKSIKHYSTTISKAHQDKLHQLVQNISGHLELQYGTIQKVKQITFFDYNEGRAYTKIDNIWHDLVRYFNTKKSTKHNILRGLPASPGKARGRCFVIHHQTLNLINSVKNGDIIVSDTTTPEMTSLIGKAAAIITDLGGVTSHAAIVCRELKIPAVVGVGNATEVIKTGDIVIVDADLGQIKLLK
jgi:excisionase family DNA binding protein